MWLFVYAAAVAFKANRSLYKEPQFIWWGPVQFTFTMQVLPKQLLAAFLLHCLLFK
jgi:hypothetical protein